MVNYIDITEYRKQLSEQTHLVTYITIYKGKKFVYHKPERSLTDQDIDRIISIVTQIEKGVILR
jgi:hypothetical protein